MASVTGFTADRMKEIEDASVVSGEVVGDHLILKRFDESTFDAGDVRGPQGVQGPGPNPRGTFIFGGWASPPIGYLILDGSLVANGAVTYPGLAACFPGWVVGSDLQLPNAYGAVPLPSIGAPGVISGSMSHTIAEAQLPSHTHTGPSHTHTGPSHTHSGPNHVHGMNHGHTAYSGNDSPNHSHTIPHHQHQVGGYTGGEGYVYRSITPGGGGGYDVINAGPDVTLYWVLNPQSSNDGGGGATSGVNTNHGHAITVNSMAGTTDFAGTGATGASGTGVTGASGTGATGATGSGNPVNHTPKNISCMVAVKT